LTELEDFEEFSVGSAQRGTWDEDTDKRRLVPADCPRCVEALAVDDDVLEKYGFVI
jgi:hypothetical protein